MELWVAYLAIGGLIGFVAGLLGVGGGMIMVPMLLFVFTAQGLSSEYRLHLALGTAIAATVFTAASSMRAHHRHGAVDWRTVRATAPGMLTGAFASALVAGLIPTRPLALMFALLLCYAATQSLFALRPRATRSLPGTTGLFGAGVAIGGVSSLLAAGGAFLSIPFLTWCGVPLRRAIGTAAANGFPIALAGAAGYVVQGLRVADMPAGSVGYVYVPALVPVVATSMLAAPLGARLAHRMPLARLRLAFAVLLYALAVRMVWSVW